MKRKIIKAVLSAVLIINLTACGNSAENKDALALVDGERISNDEYLKELDFYQKYYTKKYGEEYLDHEVERNKTNNDVLEKELIDSMIKDQVMKNDLKANGVKVDDNTATSIRNNLEDQLGSQDSLKANIKAIGLDENKFNQVIYNDSIRKQHYNYFLGHSGIKDSEILEFYKANEKYHKQYKYNVLAFDDKNEAEKAFDKINSPAEFKSYLDNPIKNYEVINSEFVYKDDPILEKTEISEKDKVSEIFEYDGKYMILMVNSYNENENELLINVKDLYLREKYEEYLNKLTKKSKIRLFA